MADYDGEEQQDQGALNEGEQDDQNQGAMPGKEDQEATEGEGQDEQDDEVVITIGEEAPPHDEEEGKAATPLIKMLRQRERELARENRELKKQAEARKQEEKPVVATAKPTLADSDWDEEDFAEKLTAWHEQQRAVKAEQESKEAEARKQQQQWDERLASYNQAKSKLSVSNYDEIEETVQGVMSQTQLGIILSGADKPEQLVYAIGSNPARLKELASITDPVKFSFAVAKLETQLKVTPRKAPPAPERTVKGNAVAVGVRDSKLDRLEAEADKTGDRSALVSYRKQLKAKANA